MLSALRTLGTNVRATAREVKAIVHDLPARTELWAGGPASPRHAKLVSARGLALEDFDAYLEQLVRIGGRLT